MTLEIGGYSIPFDEMPDRGTIPFVRKQRWQHNEGYGLIGRVSQMTGVDALTPRLHFTASQATVDALGALYAAQASGAGPYLVQDTDLPEPWATGFMALIVEFDPQFNDSTPGYPWYDCWVSLEEKPT